MTDPSPVGDSDSDVVAVALGVGRSESVALRVKLEVTSLDDVVLRDASGETLTVSRDLETVGVGGGVDEGVGLRDPIVSDMVRRDLERSDDIDAELVAVEESDMLLDRDAETSWDRVSVKNGVTDASTVAESLGDELIDSECCVADIHSDSESEASFDIDDDTLTDSVGHDLETVVSEDGDTEVVGVGSDTDGDGAVSEPLASEVMVFVTVTSPVGDIDTLFRDREVVGSESDHDALVMVSAPYDADNDPSLVGDTVTDDVAVRPLAVRSSVGDFVATHDADRVITVDTDIVLEPLTSWLADTDRVSVGHEDEDDGDQSEPVGETLTDVVGVSDADTSEDHEEVTLSDKDPDWELERVDDVEADTLEVSDLVRVRSLENVRVTMGVTLGGDLVTDMDAVGDALDESEAAVAERSIVKDSEFENSIERDKLRLVLLLVGFRVASRDVDGTMAHATRTRSTAIILQRSLIRWVRGLVRAAPISRLAATSHMAPPLCFAAVITASRGDMGFDAMRERDRARERENPRYQRRLGRQRNLPRQRSDIHRGELVIAKNRGVKTRSYAAAMRARSSSSLARRLFVLRSSFGGGGGGGGGGATRVGLEGAACPPPRPPR